MQKITQSQRGQGTCPNSHCSKEGLFCDSTVCPRSQEGPPNCTHTTHTHRHVHIHTPHTHTMMCSSQAQCLMTSSAGSLTHWMRALLRGLHTLHTAVPCVLPLARAVEERQHRRHSGPFLVCDIFCLTERETFPRTPLWGKYLLINSRGLRGTLRLSHRWTV